MTRRELEITDIKEIIRILDQAKVLRLGLVDDGMPYIVPMNYGYEMKDGKLTFYLHSALKGYKIDVIQKNSICCVEIDCDVAPFEGEKPCMNGMAYSCVMGRGKATFISEDTPEEKIYAMKNLMKVQTGKDYDFTERHLSAVKMIKVEIDEFTAKKRPHPLER